MECREYRGLDGSPIPAMPPNQDQEHPQTKPPSLGPLGILGHFYHLDYDSMNGIEESDCTTPPVKGVGVGDLQQSSRIEDITELPQGDPSRGNDTLSPVHDTIEEEEEEFFWPTSLSSQDGGGHHQPSPESEKGHKGKGEWFSQPKSLSSQMDVVESVNHKCKHCDRKSSVEHWRSLMDVVNKLKNEVDSLKSERERKTSAGHDGNGVNEKNTVPWQLVVYEDLKKMGTEFCRVCLPKIVKTVAFCSFIVAVGCIGFLYGRANRA